MIDVKFGTEGGNRTHTEFPQPDFESGASTSSATPATKVGDYNDYTGLSEVLIYCRELSHLLSR